MSSTNSISGIRHWFRRVAPVVALSAVIPLSGCMIAVTPDGTPYAMTSPSPGTAVISASPTSGGNNREFFWAASDLVEANATSCATFANGSGIDQQGIALRINTGGGHTQALTVTRNIWLDEFYYFNFHVWDTANTSSPFTLLGSVNLQPYLGTTNAVYPLNMCARTSGGLLQFIIWKQGQSPPSWNTTTQGGSVPIPAGAPATGQNGWFAAHITPGTSSLYTNLTVDGLTSGPLT